MAPPTKRQVYNYMAGGDYKQSLNGYENVKLSQVKHKNGLKFSKHLQNSNKKNTKKEEHPLRVQQELTGIAEEASRRSEENQSALY